jgi:protein-tyrosine-phosphatase
MARELFLKYLVGNKTQIDGNFQVLSAGIHTRDGLPASKEAIEVLAEEHINLNGHRSLQITETIVNDADIILTMSTAHRDFLKHHFPQRADITFDLKFFAGEKPGDIEDPYGLGLEAYRKSLRQMQKLIPPAVERIIADYINNRDTEVK